MPLKHWQAWGIDHLSRKPAAGFDHPPGKEMLPNVQSKPLLAQLWAIPTHPITGYQGEEIRCPTALLFYGKEGGSKLWTKDLWGKGIFNSFLMSCFLAKLPSEEHWLLLANPACSTWSDTVHMNTTSPLQPSAGSKPSLDVCCAEQPGKPAEPGKDLITSHWGEWGPGGQSPNARCVAPNTEQRWWVSPRDRWRDLINLRPCPWEWTLSNVNFTRTI